MTSRILCPETWFFSESVARKSLCLSLGAVATPKISCCPSAGATIAAHKIKQNISWWGERFP